MNTGLRQIALILLLFVVLISGGYHGGDRGAVAATPDAKPLQVTNQSEQTQLSETVILQQRLGRFADQQKELEVWLKEHQKQLATADQKVQMLKQEIAQLEPGNLQAQVLQQRLKEFEVQQNQLKVWTQQRIEQLKVTRQQMQSLRQGMSELENQPLATPAQSPQSDEKRAPADIVQVTLLEWLQQELVQLEKDHRLTISEWLLKQTSSSPVELDQLAKTSPEQAPNPTQTPSADLKPALTARPEQKQPAQSEPTVLTGLESVQPGHNELSEGELDRLALERELTLLDKQLAEEALRPSVASLAPVKNTQPMGHARPVLSNLPSACIAPVQDKLNRLEQSSHNSDVWFQEVFECDTCCAPLLSEIMDIHTNHVAAQPHTLVLFDFDTYILPTRYQQQIDTLLSDFNPNTDHLLLIGRASPIGDHAYNVVLSGKRAGEIKDYVMEKYSVTEAQIRHLYFGYDPPQLTLEHAASYGIKPEDLSRIDTAVKTSPQDKVNQSVIVIVYKGRKQKS